ncbi:MAG TPA: cache domain-containing protein [Herpetosiphonaceae bacterium]
MRRGLHILTSRISNKIILPYLVVVVCIAIAMTFVTVRLTVGALQERIDNRLIEAGQVTSDALVAAEDQQLTQLRAMVFTQGVAESLLAGDQAALNTLLRPHWANARLEALVVFDRRGQPLLAWDRPAGSSVDAAPSNFQARDLPGWWLVQQIVAGRSDALGDKFSAFHDHHFYTAAPVRQDGQVIGGMMVGLPLDQLLEQLQRNSQASITTLYDAEGRAVATTQVLPSGSVAPAIPAPLLAQLRAKESSAEPFHLQDSTTLNGREYQLAYSPLRVRRATNGFFSVGVSRQFIVDTWAAGRLPLVALTMVLIGAVVGVGVGVSQRITHPLQHLANTARAVTNGELRRRSTIASRDEIGVVARSFNQMTERLLHLYETSRTLSASIQTTAILTQTQAAVEPLVPGAQVMALLNEQHGWRCYLDDGAAERWRGLSQHAARDSAAILALARSIDKPRVMSANDPRLQALALPGSIAEICCMALTVQHELVGLLLFLHAAPGAINESVMVPLAAIGSMAAPALNNARLYAAIQAEGDRRRVILESIADGVVVCDAERQIVLMSAAAETLLDLHDWAERRYHFDQLPLKPLARSGAALAAAPDRYEAYGRILRVTCARLPAADDGLSGEVIVLHDITDEAALDQAKTNLIALISHELRTPLTTIQGAVDMLRQGIGGQLSPVQSELAETALRQSRAMSSLIDKALIVANLETDSLQLNIQPTELQIALQGTIRSLQSAAADARVEMHVDLPGNLPAVMADARMIQVALEEVVGNALKYGDGAPVEISAYAEGDDVILAVRDYGPGIAPEEQAQLFQRLSRSADSINTALRGLGLGLVMTRELLERQGGAIGVQSTPGEGSLFTITLPGVSRAVEAQSAA